MSFLDVRFPIDISFGAVGGPGFLTDVAGLNSGVEQRNQSWKFARCTYDVSRPIVSEKRRTELLAFFRLTKGRAHSFRFRDFTDYTVSAATGIIEALAGSPEGHYFQLMKRYTIGSYTADRTITLPVKVVLMQGGIALDAGADYILDPLTGIATMIGSPPAAPDSWTGEFDVPCRFDVDQLKMVAEDLNFFRSQSIPVIEVRPEAAP